jgi:predicted dehydrogenase
MAKRKLNVAVIGYDFMGRARSNACRQVARFIADAPFEPALKDFMRAIAKAEPPRPNLEDGVQNQLVLDAIARSAESGRWEKVRAS